MYTIFRNILKRPTRDLGTVDDDSMTTNNAKRRRKQLRTAAYITNRDEFITLYAIILIL